MIPDTFPSFFLDRGFYALKHIGEMVIQMEAVFTHRLDADRLELSLQLLMDAEPILGCRFDPSGELGCWRRLPANERPGLVIARDSAQYEEQRAAPLAVETGPIVRACLWPQESGDHLLLRVAHHVADAGAVKQIASLLSSIYSRLDGEPEYRPIPNIEGERGLAQVTRLLPWTSRFPILGALIREGMTQSFGKRCQALLLEAGERTDLRFMTRTVKAGQVKKLVEVGRRYQATLNDIMLTAGFRALAGVTGWLRETNLSFNMSVDLRRYLPEGESSGICNLSGIETISLGRRLEERFEDTLKRVSKKTSARKRGWIGLNIYGSPMAKMLEGMSLEKYTKTFVERYDLMTRKRKVAPTLTNMGVVPDIEFDGAPSNCHLLVPPVFPPGASIGLSGYRGTLTLCTAAYSPDHAKLESFLDACLSELSSTED